jgi:translation initiation factor 1
MKRKRAPLTAGEGWALAATCSECGRDQPNCRCDRSDLRTSGQQPVVRLRLEKRRGKAVTVCRAEGVAEDELRVLARKLRTLCGTGGTTKQDELELQGDHRTRLREWLAASGYRVKG